MERRLVRPAIGLACPLTLRSLGRRRANEPTLTANGHEYRKKSRRTADGRRFTQIRWARSVQARKIGQGWALDSAIAQDFAKEMNELHPEIYNWRLLGELNRSQHYLRKSASICGSFVSFSCLFVSIRGAVHSGPFVVAFEL